MKVVPILKKEIIACLTAFQESTIVCGFLTHAVVLDDTIDLFDNCIGTHYSA